jgi:small subunit ribosomal protein S16
MALAIRLTRGGRRNRPYYSIVVADKRYPRDGRFLEKVGSYNPLLPQTDDKRVVLNAERIQHWMSQGAQPTERVAIFLAKAGLGKMPKIIASPKKSAPKTKAQERLKERADKAAKAAEAAAAPAPVEAPAAEEAKAAE